MQCHLLTSSECSNHGSPDWPQMAVVLMRTIATMLAPWKSCALLRKRLSFSDAISATFADVSQKIVLRQLHKPDHGTLILHDTDGSKHVSGAPATTGVFNRRSDGTVRPLEEGQANKTRESVIKLHMHSPSAWAHILLANDISCAEGVHSRRGLP